MVNQSLYCNIRQTISSHDFYDFYMTTNNPVENKTIGLYIIDMFSFKWEVTNMKIGFFFHLLN